MLSLALRASILAGALIAAPSYTFAEVTIGTWNIQRLGHNNQKSFPKLAEVASKVEFLAIQEVMTEDAVAKLESAVEKLTGTSWSSIQSHAIGRGSYKEHYAFMWRDDAVSYEDGAVTYLDRRDTFEREPFSARFRDLDDNQLFVAATVHILYGKDTSDRTPEIKALADYWSWLEDVYENTPNLFLMGDFNMPPNDPSWRPLKAHAKPLITSGASTLSAKEGKFASLYDNIWVRRVGGPAVEASIVLNYPRLIGWSHTKSRRHVSDHAPVLAQVKLSSSAPGAASAGLGSELFRHREREGSDLLPSTLATAGSPIIGNRKSQIYHRPECPSYNAVSAKNRVEFVTEDSASEAGYRLAGNCR